MDFGWLTMDGARTEPPDETSKQKGTIGSLPFKQERSADEPWRASKLFKPNEFDVSGKDPFPESAEAGSFFLRSGSTDHDGQTMLSFSSSTDSKAQEPLFLGGDGSSRYQEFPFFQPQRTPFYPKGNVLARCNEGGYGALSRYRGPFTPSQWMELEHQALIYKHFVANVPVPSNLLIPIKKSLTPFAFSSLSSGSYLSNSLGWGPFHLGFSRNSDPEPGRCRRTDGKKWRCARDVVHDQKYCERHINRGRHRSRKPVEGQTGQAVSGSTTPKVVPIASSSASIISSGGRIQDPRGFSSISPTINLKSKDSPLSVQKQQVTFEESAQPDFGIVSSYSLLNPSQKSSMLNSKNSNPLTGFDGQETQNQNPYSHFLDNYAKDQSDRGSVAWPGELKSDWTELSMSIPMISSNISSSSNSNSPQQKKSTLSPLRLAGEFDPIPMGLSVGNDSSDLIRKQANWIPVSWGNSMGGPLGEVLNGTAGDSKSSSALNLGTEKWESSPHFGSSPTGVLQNSTFASLSNSSAGSSPRCENIKAAPEASSFCDEVRGSTSAIT